MYIIHVVPMICLNLIHIIIIRFRYYIYLDTYSHYYGYSIHFCMFSLSGIDANIVVIIIITNKITMK